MSKSLLGNRILQGVKMNLDLQQKLSDRLPTLVWHFIRFNHFEDSSIPEFELAQTPVPNAEDLAQTLFELLGPLSTWQLHQLFSALKKFVEQNFSNDFDNQFAEKLATKLFALQGMRFHPENLETLQILAQLPENFQKWLAEKNLSLRELKTLYWFVKKFSVQKISSHLEKISTLNLSHSDGTKALEWCCELVAMNNTNLDIHSTANSTSVSATPNPVEWLRYLQALRYPNSSQKELVQKNELAKIAWPTHLQARWQRNQDQCGVEIKFFASTIEQFKQITTRLQNLHDPVEQIWKN